MNFRGVDIRLAQWFYGAVTAVVFCGADAAFAEDYLVPAGRERYENDCAACHGTQARGAGVVTSVLTVRPSDLTRLSKDNRGEFPEDYVRRVIDGRELPPAAHGETGMPVWGKHYKPNLPAYSEQRVQQKIDELVAYLKSVQVE